MRRPPALLNPLECPHLTLDARDPARFVCMQCGTPWAVVRAADNSDRPDLFGGAA